MGTAKENEDFRVSMTFGKQRWRNIPFQQAATVIETYVKAEHQACERLVKQINKDHWITSFWSEVLGGASPPAHKDWIAPITMLQSARSAYRGKNYPAARKHLLAAATTYNAVHKKWIGYRDALEKGGGRAITTIEITIAVLSAVATAGHGASVAAGGTRLGWLTIPARGAALKTAGMATGVAGATSAAKQLGLVVQGVEKKIDVGQIALDAGAALVASLVGGKLSQKFLGMMTPRVTAAMTFDKSVLEAARRAHVLLPNSYALSQDVLADFLGGVGANIVTEAVKTAAVKAKGKDITMAQLMTLIAQEVGKQTLASSLKAYFTARAH